MLTKLSTTYRLTLTVSQAASPSLACKHWLTLGVLLSQEGPLFFV
jgi:hypothetical protein